MGFFFRDEPVEVDEDDLGSEDVPERTRVILECPSCSADLWHVARDVEARMREFGRPESLPERPPVSIKPPARYTWWWAGDEEEALLQACDDVITSKWNGHKIRSSVQVTGGGRRYLPSPTPLEELEERGPTARRGTFEEVELEAQELAEDIERDLEQLRAEEEQDEG